MAMSRRTSVREYRFWLRDHLSHYQESVDRRSPRRFVWVMFACLVLGTALIVSTAYMPRLYGFEQGTKASRTVVASETVVVVDEQTTLEARNEVANLVEPVYSLDAQAVRKAETDLQSLFKVVTKSRAEYGRSSTLAEAVAEVRAKAPSLLTNDSIETLITATDAEFATISRQALGSLSAVYSQSITTDGVEAARDKLRAIANALSLSTSSANAVYESAAGYVRTNQAVDAEQTQARKQAAMKEVAPVMITVPRGEQVVKQGDIVTSQDALVLQALGITQTRSGWEVWLGVFLVCLLEGVVFFRLLYRFNKSTGLDNIMVLTLVVLILGFTVLARLLVLNPLSPYLVPVAGLGMVVAIVLNARSGFLSVVLLALNLALITDMSMRHVFVAILVGAFAVYLVSRVVQRAELLGAGALVMVASAATIFVMEFFLGTGTGSALKIAIWGLAAGALSWVLTVLLLLLLDLVVSLNTPLRLLELANPAQPLLRKLLQVAPGTYNHSISMGNLAEAAAEAIGADPLLARVGAYYHDIGKTVRPEYFVENQIYVDNPHDRLSPNLSKLAIAAHVRDGEHLAKLHGLPKQVVDIIKQHHGTSVMAFFYHKAQEASTVPVDEETYRYEEEKPRSKEAAIIMLADGTEAAVRAMQNPTRRKIQGMIQEVFRQRIQDGQLDECDLTLSDLHKIRDSFDTSLRGLVGHRIAYPDKNDQQDKKSDAAANGKSKVPNGKTAEPPAAEPAGATRLRVPPSAAALARKGQVQAAPTEAAAPTRGPAEVPADDTAAEPPVGGPSGTDTAEGEPGGQ